LCASSLCCATGLTMTSSAGGAARPRPRRKEGAA
jgi:hypothetical protein